MSEGAGWKEWKKKKSEEGKQTKKRREIDGGKKLAFKKEIQSHTVDIPKKVEKKEKRKFIRRKGGLQKNKKKKVVSIIPVFCTHKLVGHFVVIFYSRC